MARELLKELELHDEISKEEWEPLRGVELTDAIGRGPARPVLGTLDPTDEDGNVALDDTQLQAMFDNHPLLIDGLLGRARQQQRRAAAVVAAASSKKKRILSLAITPVIDRIRREIQW